MPQSTESQVREMERLGNITLVVVIILLILAYITVGLRLWVRYKITKSPGWDDLAMVATLILYTCYCAFITTIKIRSESVGLLDPEDAHVTFTFIQLSEVFYILTTTTLKISLGLFFLQVLTKRWQTLVFQIILGASAVYGLFYVLTTIFACGNPAKMAGTLLGSKKCFSRAFILATGYLYGLMNIIADWTFVLVPICVLVDSKLDRRSKISVSIVMALGAIGSVSSIMRMIYLDGLLTLIGAGGITTQSIKAAIWATAEPGTGIVAASIALLRPLLRNMATSVRNHASTIRSRKAPSGGPASDDDTIALNSQSQFGTKTNCYSTHAEEPWIPPHSAGKPLPQRSISVKTTYERGSIRTENIPPPVPPK